MNLIIRLIKNFLTYNGLIRSRDKTLQASDKNLRGEILDRTTFHNTTCLEVADDNTELHINEPARPCMYH